MRYKLVDEQPRTYVLIFDTGDELTAGLKRFASEQEMSGSSFKAIGAFSSVRLGWFNWETKKYQVSVAFDEQLELLS
jgi:predicted DNA-binding protein with PD1-like motif